MDGSPEGRGSAEAEPGRELRLALWLFPGVSARRIRLAEEAGAARGDLASRAALVAALELRGAHRERLLAAPELGEVAAAERRRLDGRGARAILRGDPDYPRGLKDLSDPPEVLQVRGSLPGGRAVAVVGPRGAPASARALATELGAALARAGIAVISGGALGVDAAAHRGALDAGGATVAVLGNGVLRPGPPSNRTLFGRMLDRGGGLASELPADEEGRKAHFPRRNRLIAALAEAVVVVAAGEGSGSLYTAKAARGLGRRLVACPGDGPAAGCEALIAEGATRVASPAELLAVLGVGGPARDRVEASPEEAALLRVLGVVPQPLAALAAASGLDSGPAARALAGLCARALARPVGPGRFAAR